MKQVAQSLSDGTTSVMELPFPQVQPGTLLIKTRMTVVSAGTERSLVEFGRANLLQKARLQPERVRMVLERIRTDGLWTTLDAVRSKLDQPLALGYCNVGEVIEVGPGVRGFCVGDRVASNGPHAEIVRVPVNLCARVPDAVSDEQAVFTVPASIALQGIRLAKPTLGETFVVIGLGLIGLLAVQLLRANGCRVLGIDPDSERMKLAECLGATALLAKEIEELEALTKGLTSGRGVDGVLITASTSSSDPVRHAARMCRKRGRIVLVGVTGLELSRADFYEKELTFQVSCSYGPGRYDPLYEQKGQDYPVGYVRWTEQRNFEAVLQTMESGQLRTDLLVTHRCSIERAAEAYDILAKDRTALGIVLTYDLPVSTERSVRLEPAASPSRAAEVRVGFIGAGNYASRILIPSFKNADMRLQTLATTGSVQGTYFAKRFGFVSACSDNALIFDSEDINLVAIATRHDSHADLAASALAAGKHVFVEKPLAITPEQVSLVESALAKSRSLPNPPTLTVGFNRRFAPLVAKMTALLSKRSQPKSFIYTINAGAIPADHWTQDPAVGGGRIIGEGCHFIDLLRYLARAPIVAIHAIGMRAGSQEAVPDTVAINLSFADGSIGSIQYFANGSRAFPKERLEVFVGGSVLRLDNFRKLEAFGWPGFRGERLWRMDKGQAAMSIALRDSILRGADQLIPTEELLEVARVTISCSQQLAASRA